MSKHQKKRTPPRTARTAPRGPAAALEEALDQAQHVLDAGLTDVGRLAALSADWSAEERTALRAVLARGGYMPWQTFDELYDNDLDESRYWQWHKPESVMGRLRLYGLLVEATVDGELWVVVHVELRRPLGQILA